MDTVFNKRLRWAGAFFVAGFGCCALAQSSTSASGAQVQQAAANEASTSAPGAVQGDPSATIKSLQHSIDTGHFADVLKSIADLRSQHQEIPGLDRMEGLALYAESNLTQADAAFAAALNKDPNDVEAAQMRGLTLFRLGHPADAIPLLERAGAKGNLGKADPNYVLALCYMDTHRYDDARRSFAAQFGFPPESAESYLLGARMMLRREYLPIALTYAQKALQLSPSLPLAHELLGEIALAGNHLDEAITEFETEKAHNPLEGSIYDRLGDAYLRAAKYDEAQRSLQEAVLLEPNTTGPYILLGKTMLKKGDAVAASTYLQRAAQMDSANYMTHSLLGQAYRALGRHEDATREAETAQRLQDTSTAAMPSPVH